MKHTILVMIALSLFGCNVDVQNAPQQGSISPNIEPMPSPSHFSSPSASASPSPIPSPMATQAVCSDPLAPEWNQLPLKSTNQDPNAGSQSEWLCDSNCPTGIDFITFYIEAVGGLNRWPIPVMFVGIAQGPFPAIIYGGPSPNINKIFGLEPTDIYAYSTPDAVDASITNNGTLPEDGFTMMGTGSSQGYTRTLSIDRSSDCQTLYINGGSFHNIGTFLQVY